jgi:hypothetical protein
LSGKTSAKSCGADDTTCPGYWQHVDRSLSGVECQFHNHGVWERDAGGVSHHVDIGVTVILRPASSHRTVEEHIRLRGRQNSGEVCRCGASTSEDEGANACSSQNVARLGEYESGQRYYENFSAPLLLFASCRHRHAVSEIYKVNVLSVPPFCRRLGAHSPGTRGWLELTSSTATRLGWRRLST